MSRPNPELVKYIETHLSKGVDIRHIKQKLAEVGHTSASIEEAAAFVATQRPYLGSRPKKVMIVYSTILILILVAAGVFVWFKVTQQVEYVGEVQKIEAVKSYQGLDDLALLKLAASGDMNACSSIKDHNTYYACTGKYWEKGDCSYEKLIDAGVSDCFNKLAVDTKKPEDCFKTSNATACLVFVASKWNDASLCQKYSECVFGLAVSKKDPASCASLNTIQKELCFTQYARFMNAPSACSDGSVDCKYYFAKTEEEKRVFFEGLDSEIEFKKSGADKFDVATELAVDNNDLFMCSLVRGKANEKGIVLETACVAQIGLNTGDATKCDVLLDSVQKSLCVNAVSSKCAVKENICKYLSV